jgi:hypothetical protein
MGSLNRILYLFEGKPHDHLPILWEGKEVVHA